MEYKKNWLEREFLSSRFSYYFSGVGTLVTIVFSLREDWLIAIAVIIVFTSLVVCSILLRYYSRQIAARFSDKESNLRKELDLTKGKSSKVARALHQYIHNTRDGAVGYTRRYQSTYTAFIKGERSTPFYFRVQA